MWALFSVSFPALLSSSVFAFFFFFLAAESFKIPFLFLLVYVL